MYDFSVENALDIAAKACEDMINTCDGVINSIFEDDLDYAFIEEELE